MGWKEDVRQALKSEEQLVLEKAQQAQKTKDATEARVRARMRETIVQLTSLVKEAHSELAQGGQAVDMEWGGDVALSWHDGRRLEFAVVDNGLALEVRRESARLLQRWNVTNSGMLVRENNVGITDVEHHFGQLLLSVIRERK